MTIKLGDVNLMVDLETLGNGSNAVILSLGVARFDKYGIKDSVYLRIDEQSCVNAGLRMDVSTVLWWMKQSDAARAAFDQPGIQLADALEKFSEWVPEGACVWGNGATFDNVILSNAYRAVGMRQPWDFWNDRCYRTVKNLYPEVEAPEFTGAKHNALDDAVHQAKHLILIAGGSYE